MRSRLVTLLTLALPMVLARASQSVITFADAIQVKHLGAKAIAATATGGLNAMTFVILPMGLDVHRPELRRAARRPRRPRRDARGSRGTASASR